MSAWWKGPLLGFDTETTGVDPRNDRIVTAALVHRSGGGTRQRTWLIDPGITIPQGAEAIHGVSTTMARAHGRPAPEALEEIATEVVTALVQQTPLVVFNAPFDLTLLAHELQRHGLPSLGQRLGGMVTPVIDPLVIDRAMDRFRRGKRRLADLCRQYKVPQQAELHTAEVDVLATLAVLDCLVRDFPELGAMPLGKLHEWQGKRQADWVASFNTWRVGKGLSPIDEGEWPMGEPRDIRAGATGDDEVSVPAHITPR